MRRTGHQQGAIQNVQKAKNETTNRNQKLKKMSRGRRFFLYFGFLGRGTLPLNSHSSPQYKSLPRTASPGTPFLLNIAPGRPALKQNAPQTTSDLSPEFHPNPNDFIVHFIFHFLFDFIVDFICEFIFGFIFDSIFDFNFDSIFDFNFDFIFDFILISIVISCLISFFISCSFYFHIWPTFVPDEKLYHVEPKDRCHDTFAWFYNVNPITLSMWMCKF